MLAGALRQGLRRFPKARVLARRAWALEQAIVARWSGTARHERYWAGRHLRGGSDWGAAAGDGWVNGYWESHTHPHRAVLLERVCRYSPASVLEFGSNCGPNLFRIAQALPECRLTGLDANAVAVEWGNRRFQQEGMPAVELRCGTADDLRAMPAKSFDLVITDAVMIYIGPDRIAEILRELARLAKRALVLIEWHHDDEGRSAALGRFYEGGWKRNYRQAVRESLGPDIGVTIDKLPDDAWPSRPWMNAGCIIDVTLA